MPVPRMMTRRWILAVAAVALVLFATHIVRLRALYRREAARHYRVEALAIRNLINEKENLDFLINTAKPGDSDDQARIEAQRKTFLEAALNAAIWSRLRENYDHLSSHPWESPPPYTPPWLQVPPDPPPLE